MGLSARLTAGMVALIVLTVAATGALTYHNVSIVEVPRALDRLDIHARLLASDLQAAFPDMRGFSPRNIWDMRRFYAECTDSLFLSQAVRELCGRS